MQNDLTNAWFGCVIDPSSIDEWTLSTDMLNPEIDLTGKTAVITGASRGIGAATARRLVHAGANVALLARSEESIKTLAQELGDKAIAIACDVSVWADVNEAIRQCHTHFGTLDILVNNAGVIDPVARLDVADPDSWSQVVDINLKGPFYGIRAALPLMKASGGVVINISSGAASNALEGWSHYCATKAGLYSLTQCVHKEYADKGIRCVGLSPGTVATDMQKVIKASEVNPVSKLDWSTHIAPETVADAITWLCTDASSSYDGIDFTLKTEKDRRALGWYKES